MKASQTETSSFVALAAHRPDTDAVNTSIGHENMSPAVQENGRRASVLVHVDRSARTANIANTSVDCPASLFPASFITIWHVKSCLAECACGRIFEKSFAGWAWHVARLGNHAFQLGFID